MNQPDSKLGQKRSNAKRLLQAVDPTLTRMEEAERVLVRKAARVGPLLSNHFSWSFWYDLPHSVVQLAALASLGSLEECVAAAKSADPQQAIVELLERELADDEIESPDDGRGSVFNPEDVLSLMMAMLRSAKSLVLYGAYMSELVERIRGGSERAFLNAVKVDRTVIFCPSVAEYAATWLAKAELLGRKEAIQQFVASVKQKPPKTLRTHRRLRFALQYMKETGLLEVEAVSREGVEFIQQLGIYSSAPGAERSLAQFVRRWQADKSPTQKHENDVADAPEA